MRQTIVTTISKIMLASIILIACQRNSYEVWEDTKTCGRHMSRGVRTLGGKQGDSRAVCCPEHFYYGEYEIGTEFVVEDDFIPLSDQKPINKPELENAVPPPKETPGDPGSTVPGIQAFMDPSTNPQLSSIFRNIHFEYNNNLVKGDDNNEIVHRVADYMRSHPRAYVFIEGHCDERGPEAYNLALGSRRSNAVRDMLVKQGVNPDNIFTISYGKEKPLVLEHHEEAWAKNRRAEFKIYQR